MNKYEVTWDDVPFDLQELVRIGIYTKEEMIEKIKCYNKEYAIKTEEPYKDEDLHECSDMDWLKDL